MSAKLTSNYKSWSKAVADFTEKTGMDVHKFMQYQMALLAKGLIRNAHQDPKKSLAAAKKVQQKNIDADLGNLFFGVKRTELMESFKDKLSAAKGANAFTTLVGGRKVEITHRQLGDHSTRSGIEAYHRSNQDKYSGRTSPISGNAVKFFAGGRILVVEATLKAYANYLKDHIGREKGGWLWSLREFSRKVRTADFGQVISPSVVAWVDKHSGRTEGTMTDQYDPKTMKGSFTAGNNVPYSKDSGRQRDYQLKLRREDIESGFAFKRLGGLIQTSFAKGGR